MSLSKNAAIGVFDSGIGGLTVVRELLKQLPGERIVYFGDTARAPYGNKSPKSLIRFALENARFLQSKKIKFLVVACNSSSAYSLPALQKACPIPVLGVILAGSRAATAKRRGAIGVIGTYATIDSKAYQNAIAEMDFSAKVWTVPCPLFVPLVEEGWNNSKVAESVAKTYLAPLKKKGVGTLVLGCTHYPLLKFVIQKVMGSKVALVDSAEETAREVKQILSESGLLSGKKKIQFSSHEFYVSDLPAHFAALGKRFLGKSLPQVKQVVFEPSK